MHRPRGARGLALRASLTLVTALAPAFISVAEAAAATAGPGPSATLAGPGGLTAHATSANWSGYVASGAAFTNVTGTFTVPAIGRYVAGTTVSEWVGIDGWSDSTLIQAGVNEIPLGEGTAMVEPWWEVLPAPEQLASGVMARAGQQITVTITQLTPGTWSISLRDDSNGDEFNTRQLYAGTLQSAEWIVEADNTSDGKPTSLAPYKPSVSFTGLALTGRRTGLTQLQMQQSGNAVSTPSALAEQGFNVTYGAHAPPAP